MANNIFQQQITPIKPKVLESERIYVYVPTATKTTKGAASFNERDFGVNNGHVSLIWSEQLLVEQLSNPLNQVSNIKVLADEFVNTNNVASITNPITGITYNSNTAEVMLNRKNRDAFVRPDFVMLDNAKDFESSTDEDGFVKYTLKRNNPLEQPSLIQVSTEDFVRENGIVKINWTNIEEAVSDLETKLQSDIDNIVNNTTKIGDANNSFATKGGTIAAGVDNAVQLGEGENTEPGTFKFRHYTLIDKDGKIYTNSGNAAAITMKLVATEDFVRNLISTLKAVTLKKVDSLPTVGETNVIYMVPAVDTDNSKDYYEEYIYTEGRWELIGTTKIDMSDIYTKTEVNDLLLTARKQIILRANGVAGDNVYNFTVESPESYIDYKTNGTKFLVDLSLPIIGAIDTTRRVAITFGDTVYYVYNILSGNEPATISNLGQVDKYNNATGYRFIAEMTFFETGDIQGFAIIPTISMSDVLSLTSDEMDHYLAEGGLSQGQLAICSKLIHTGYVEGTLYRFDIEYPDTYTWTSLSKSTTITRVTDTDITTTEYNGKVELSEEQYNTLIVEGKVEVNGKIIEYNDNTEYETPDTSYSVKQGTSAPTTTTVGAVGQFYLDTTNKKLYQCMSITQETVDDVDTNVYEWNKVGSQEILTGSTNPTSTTAGEVGQLYIQTDINKNVKIWQCCKSDNNSNSWINIGGTNAYSFSNSFTAGGAWNADSRSVAIGYSANASRTLCVQLLEGTNTIAGSFQIRNDNIYKTDTHTLTVQNAEINGTPAYGVLSGTSAPTTTTVGAVGQFYLDTTNKKLYQCVAINIEDLTYEWKQIGGGSGKYLHRIYIIGINYRVYFEMTTGDNNVYDKYNIVQAIKDYINTTTTNNILATGYISNNTYGLMPVIGINYFSDTYINIYYIKNNLILASIDDTSHMVTGITTSYSASSVLSSNITELTDTIIEL